MSFRGPIPGGWSDGVQWSPSPDKERRSIGFSSGPAFSSSPGVKASGTSAAICAEGCNASGDYWNTYCQLVWWYYRRRS